MGSIFVVVDSKDPFSVSQQSDLKNIVQNLEFLMLGQIDWASIQTLQTELKAFGIAASQAMPTDYIAKVDSDVLFFSEDKIAEVCVCGSDFVGDGHYSSYAYAQGGLYFLRASLAIELSISVSVAELEQMILQCHSRSEDVVMSSLVRKHTDSIWLTRLMLFPDEFSKTNLNRRWVKQEFSALHFVHRKADMPRYADRLKLI